VLQRIHYAVWQLMVQGVFMTFFGGRAYNRHHIPKEGGMLVVSNHQSYLDPILAAAPILRPFNPMARDSLFRNKLFAAFISYLYAFPVKRASADLKAVKDAISRLRQGRIVLMFPEGTRTRDGSIGSLHSGTILIARRARVPILPMVIDGAYECWPKGQRLPNFSQVRIMYGQPISVKELRQTRPEEMAKRLHNEMLRLQAEIRRKEPAHE